MFGEKEGQNLAFNNFLLIETSIFVSVSVAYFLGK